MEHTGKKKSTRHKVQQNRMGRRREDGETRKRGEVRGIVDFFFFRKSRKIRKKMGFHNLCFTLSETRSAIAHEESVAKLRKLFKIGTERSYFVGMFARVFHEVTSRVLAIP